MQRRDRPQRSPSPRILVAGSDDAIRMITQALDQEARLVPARRVVDAVRLADADVDAVVCDLSFDDSRLFTLLRALSAKGLDRRVSIVCCEWPKANSPLAREAIATLLDSHGVHTRLDVRSLTQRYGSAVASEVVCRVIMNRVREMADDRACAAHA